MTEVRTLSISDSCPACQSLDTTRQGEKNGFEMLSCKDCRTLYCCYNVDSTTAQDYANYYHDRNLSIPEFVNKQLDEIVESFCKHRGNGRLLDVGFGSGALLQAAKRAGWEVYGVEVSRSAVEHVQKLGVNAYLGELAEAKYPGHYFDVVTLSELLEHVANPNLMLREIGRILRPGGLLWATTPNGRGASARMLGVKWSVVAPPEHLHLFSLKGMKTLLAAEGFNRICIEAQGMNPFEIIQSLRRPGSTASMEAFDRVRSSYRLNEFLTESPLRRRLKGALNQLLRVSHLGDSLKIRAET